MRTRTLITNHLSVGLVVGLFVMLTATSAWARRGNGNGGQGPPPGTPGGVAALQAQLDALAAQVQALEDSAPDSSVDGRTYCHVLEVLAMRGADPAGTERLQSTVLRRTTTFSGGSFFGAFLSRVRLRQDDNGAVLQFITSGGPFTGTYLQTGNRLDVTASGGAQFTWYVSKDGSVIYGTGIHQPPSGVDGAGNVITHGTTRNWILIENGDCAMEIIQ